MKKKVAKVGILRGVNTMKNYRVCIVGATGVVGQAFISCLEKRKFPISELVLFASSQSIGKEFKFHNTMLKVRELKVEELKGFDFAFFSAGTMISKEFVPIANKSGAIVIDNSNAFRMEKDVPLVVPEVNADVIKKHKGIIANPNCSTIQMVVVLKPLHDYAKIKRVVVSTYQAISGAGGKALIEFKNETYLLTGSNKFRAVISEEKFHKHQIFPRQIAFNAIPQIPQRDAFLSSGYTIEENKLIEETKKILDDHSIKITATCVRVPIFNGHSESINIEMEKELTTKEAIKILSSAPGIKVCTEQDKYPTPAEVSGTDLVCVGRIRKDASIKNGLNLWVVADNILKGAALNAVQIAEYLLRYE